MGGICVYIVVRAVVSPVSTHSLYLDSLLELAVSISSGLPCWSAREGGRICTYQDGGAVQDFVGGFEMPGEEAVVIYVCMVESLVSQIQIKKERLTKN